MMEDLIAIKDLTTEDIKGLLELTTKVKKRPV